MGFNFSMADLVQSYITASLCVKTYTGYLLELFVHFCWRYWRERDWETEWEGFWAVLAVCYGALCLWCGIAKGAQWGLRTNQRVQYSWPLLKSAASQRGLIQQCVLVSCLTSRPCAWCWTYTPLVMVVPLDEALTIYIEVQLKAVCFGIVSSIKNQSVRVTEWEREHIYTSRGWRF